MTRKDEKDTERPHYYSQFWLDVAAGRREIGASKTDESADADDLAEPVAPLRRGSRETPSVLTDGYRNSRARAIEEEDFAESEPEEEDFMEPEVEEDELASDLDEENTPDILFGDTGSTAEEVPSANQPLPEEDEEAIEDEDYFDEEEDEDEDEDEWAARGRKKPKPGRQAKAPKPPVKKPRRGGRAF